MEITISNLYVVVYKNGLNNELNADSKLHDNKEIAEKIAKELNGFVRPVFYTNKK